MQTNSFLSFKIGEETFAANVRQVINILELCEITSIPQAPSYLKGVINLRGTVLPVVDTKIKFELGETSFTAGTCILVLEVNIDNEPVRVGALVDSVQEVLELDEDHIKAPPKLGEKYRSEYIIGVAHLDEKFIMILDMDNLFSMNELSTLKNEYKENEPLKI